MSCAYYYYNKVFSGWVEREREVTLGVEIQVQLSIF
jgi:hypothetical protein